MAEFSTYTPKIWHALEMIKRADMDHIERGIALNNELIADILEHGVTNLPEAQMEEIRSYIDTVIQNLNLDESITVDEQISESSTNPVQNKVIYEALENKSPHIIGHRIVFGGLRSGDNIDYPEQEITDAEGVGF